MLFSLLVIRLLNNALIFLREIRRSSLKGFNSAVNQIVVTVRLVEEFKALIFQVQDAL